MNRTTKKNTAWVPGESYLVFPLHFVDRKPSLQNPNQTLNLGYQKAAKKPRRALIRKNPQCADCVIEAGEQSSEMANISDSDMPIESSICEHCLEKDILISSLSEQLQALSLEENKLKSQVEGLTASLRSQSHTQPFSCSSIKTDNVD